MDVNFNAGVREKFRIFLKLINFNLMDANKSFLIDSVFGHYFITYSV